ncbi:MAG TPA: ATP-binding cassette domain-containing protein [Candidatus Kapabacteria bacterium]|nr:ATP-binding cassette domain-containing protein [Candidatus Kapabacteria bacterium]
MIEIVDMHKSFGSKVVLNGVSMSIADGESFCIIGKSGTGKSVMLKHIVGLLNPDKGYVKVDGQRIDQLTKNELFSIRKTMGYVFQGAALFDSMTVFENLVLSLYEDGERDLTKMKQEAIRVLSAVDLLPDLKYSQETSFIKEWDIISNKKPSDLSGGMRKRVGVARALVGSPKYIFYDEPTTGLDPVTSEQIDIMIKDIADKIGVTSVIITHDMFSVFKVAHKVAMLNDGKLIFYGTPSEMRSSTDKIVVEFLDRYIGS